MVHILRFLQLQEQSRGEHWVFRQEQHICPKSSSGATTTVIYCMERSNTLSNWNQPFSINSEAAKSAIQYISICLKHMLICGSSVISSFQVLYEFVNRGRKFGDKAEFLHENLATNINQWLQYVFPYSAVEMTEITRYLQIINGPVFNNFRRIRDVGRMDDHGFIRTEFATHFQTTEPMLMVHTFARFARLSDLQTYTKNKHIIAVRLWILTSLNCLKAWSSWSNILVSASSWSVSKTSPCVLAPFFAASRLFRWWNIDGNFCNEHMNVGTRDPHLVDTIA